MGTRNVGVIILNVGSRWGLVVNAAPLPLDLKERARALIVQENVWDLGQVWTAVQKSSTHGALSSRPFSSRPFSSRPFSCRPFSCRPFSSRPFSCRPFSCRPFSCRPFSSLRLTINPLNAELNPICRLLALLGAHHILHVSRITVKIDKASIVGTV
jgi:hypothetical protein